jgi:hypothetical protein
VPWIIWCILFLFFHPPLYLFCKRTCRDDVCVRCRVFRLWIQDAWINACTLVLVDLLQKRFRAYIELFCAWSRSTFSGRSMHHPLHLPAYIHIHIFTQSDVFRTMHICVQTMLVLCRYITKHTKRMYAKNINPCAWMYVHAFSWRQSDAYKATESSSTTSLVYYKVSEEMAHARATSSLHTTHTHTYTSMQTWRNPTINLSGPRTNKQREREREREKEIYSCLIKACKLGHT